jgi:redox-sensitive bicupin YhaK (pirin superfamily)
MPHVLYLCTTMTIKHVELTVAPPEPHMVGDGFRVHNFIPSTYRLDMHRMDPFIMMDYNAKTTLPPSEIPGGVGVHPHRGFETVSIAYKGSVEQFQPAGWRVSDGAALG